MVEIPHERDYDGLAQTLTSARNDLMFIMGICMQQAKECVDKTPTLVGICGRKFADAAASFLMLKFVADFKFLEDITKGGDYEEPIPLAQRIHVHLKGTQVPASALNAMEDLRIFGNMEVFVYGNARTLDTEEQLKVLFLMRLLGKYIVRGGSVGQRVRTSARPDGRHAQPPGPKALYIKGKRQPRAGAHAHAQPHQHQQRDAVKVRQAGSEVAQASSQHSPRDDVPAVVLDTPTMGAVRAGAQQHSRAVHFSGEGQQEPPPAELERTTTHVISPSSLHENEWEEGFANRTANLGLTGEQSRGGTEEDTTSQLSPGTDGDARSLGNSSSRTEDYNAFMEDIDQAHEEALQREAQKYQRRAGGGNEPRPGRKHSPPQKSRSKSKSKGKSKNKAENDSKKAPVRGGRGARGHSIDMSKNPLAGRSPMPMGGTLGFMAVEDDGGVVRRNTNVSVEDFSTGSNGNAKGRRSTGNGSINLPLLPSRTSSQHLVMPAGQSPSSNKQQQQQQQQQQPPRLARQNGLANGDGAGRGKRSSPQKTRSTARTTSPSKKSAGKSRDAKRQSQRGQQAGNQQQQQQQQRRNAKQQTQQPEKRGPRRSTDASVSPPRPRNAPKTKEPILVV